MTISPTAIYMEWREPDPKNVSLKEQITEALAWYRKYHGEPTVILLPPMTKHDNVYGIPVRCDGLVKPGEIYIGHD